MEGEPLKSNNGSIPGGSSLEQLSAIEAENKKRDLDQKIMEYFDNNRKLNQDVSLIRDEYVALKARVQSTDEWSAGMQDLFKRYSQIEKRREDDLKGFQKIVSDADHAGLNLDIYSE